MKILLLIAVIFFLPQVCLSASSASSAASGNASAGSSAIAVSGNASASARSGNDTISISSENKAQAIAQGLNASANASNPENQIITQTTNSLPNTNSNNIATNKKIEPTIASSQTPASVDAGSTNKDQEIKEESDIERVGVPLSEVLKLKTNQEELATKINKMIKYVIAGLILLVIIIINQIVLFYFDYNKFKSVSQDIKLKF